MSSNGAKIDFSNFSNLEEITSQRYPSSRREQVIKFGYLPLKNKFNHKKGILCPEPFSPIRKCLPCQF